MARKTLDEYKADLRKLTNAELVDRTGSEILGAAILESRGRVDNYYDDCATACYEEAHRRDNPDLYQRGFNAAVRSQGHDQLVRKVETPLSVGEQGREDES